MYLHYSNENNMNRIKFTIKKEDNKNEKKKKSIAHVTIPHTTEVLIAIQYIMLH